MSSNKAAVVVGVGPGLGAAVSRRLAREGFSVGLMARTAAACEAVRQGLEGAGGRAQSVRGRPTPPPSRQPSRAWRRRSRPVEVLIYNASVFRVAGALELTPRARGRLEDQLPRRLPERAGGAARHARARPGDDPLHGRHRLRPAAEPAASLAVGKAGLRALARSRSRASSVRAASTWRRRQLDGLIDAPRVRAMVPGGRPPPAIARAPRRDALPASTPRRPSADPRDRRAPVGGGSSDPAQGGAVTDRRGQLARNEGWQRETGNRPRGGGAVGKRARLRPDLAAAPARRRDDGRRCAASSRASGSRGSSSATPRYRCSRSSAA